MVPPFWLFLTRALPCPISFERPRSGGRRGATGEELQGSVLFGGERVYPAHAAAASSSSLSPSVFHGTCPLVR